MSYIDRLLKVAVYIVVGSVLGGEKKKSEKARLRKGINVLVATPGRVLDHLLHTHAFQCAHVETLVLGMYTIKHLSIDHSIYRSIYRDI